MQSSIANIKTSDRLSVLVFGAGAIGTYFGGSLALAGHNVVFVEQPKMVSELRERGLRLDLTIDERRKHALPKEPRDNVSGVEGTKDAFVIKIRSF
ncbi:MAG: 2-dehydropantoate 2-reductase N-terminal domain-containing protein, partial [Anaerolineales bacterium]|nr:2-dehydropantoate 2-reductase N-terminal domain-containing protein [Anaerolineales bacterium]